MRLAVQMAEFDGISVSEVLERGLEDLMLRQALKEWRRQEAKHGAGQG